MSISGYKIKAAFAIEKIESLGDATTVSDMLHIVAESIIPKMAVEALPASDGMVIGIDRVVEHSGEVTLEAHYDGIAPLMIFMGREHEVSPISKGSGAYLHYVEFDRDVGTRPKMYLDKYSPSGSLQRRGTLVIDKSVEIWEYASCFVSDLTIDINMQRVNFVLTFQPTVLANSNLVNTSSSSWSLPDGSRLKLQDATVYLKPLSQFTLSASKTLTFQEFGSANINTATVTSGTYYGRELAKALEAAMRSVSDFGWKYWVEYVPELRRFWIIGEGSFQITGGTISEIIGYKTHGYQTEHYSDFMAKADGQAVYDSTYEVQVAALSINASRQFEWQSATEYPLRSEPSEGGASQITGTIERVRYGNDFLSDVSRLVGDLFSMRVEFTGELIGGSNYEEFIIDLPVVKLTPVEASVNGAEVLQQRLTFQAVSPTVGFDFKNYGEGEYFLRYVTAPGTVEAIGIYQDRLYAVCTVSSLHKLYQLDDTGFTYLADVPVEVSAMREWDGYLWLGTVGTQVYFFDGEDVSLSGSLSGVTSVVDFEAYDDKLFAIDSATGDVWVFDTTWSKSYSNPSSPKSGMALRTYGDKLYAALRQSDWKVFEYDGTSWVESLAFSAGTGKGDLLVHGGYLWACANFTGFANLYRYDGSSWTAVTGTSANNKRRLISLGGEILFTYKGTSSDGALYHYDVGSQAETLIRDLSVNFQDSRPVVYDNVVFIPASSSNLYYYDPLKVMVLKFQNKNSANYLQ